MVSCVLSSCSHLFRVINIEFLPKSTCHIRDWSSSVVKHLTSMQRALGPDPILYNYQKIKKTGIQLLYALNGTGVGRRDYRTEKRLI